MVVHISSVLDGSQIRLCLCLLVTSRFGLTCSYAGILLTDISLIFDDSVYLTFILWFSVSLTYQPVLSSTCLILLRRRKTWAHAAYSYGGGENEKSEKKKA